MAEHKPLVFWITGRPGAGKEALAHKIAAQIYGVVIHGPAIRKETGNSDFSYPGINCLMWDIFTHAADFLLSGRNVVIACTSPYKDMREKFQNMLP